MKLLDYQEKELIIRYNMMIKTVRRVRIKIFNEKGYAAANIVIPFGKMKGATFGDISAYVYNLDENGKVSIQKVDKKQIYQDEANDKVRDIRFTFPNIRAGSVIEYRYEKKEKESEYI